MWHSSMKRFPTSGFRKGRFTFIYALCPIRLKIWEEGCFTLTFAVCPIRLNMKEECFTNFTFLLLVQPKPNSYKCLQCSPKSHIISWIATYNILESNILYKGLFHADNSLVPFLSGERNCYWSDSTPVTLWDSLHINSLHFLAAFGKKSTSEMWRQENCQ